MNALKRFNSLPRLNARHHKQGQSYLAKLRLLGSIVHSVAPILAAMAQADLAMDKATTSRRGRENQDCTYDLVKYGARVCALVTPGDSGDLAKENDTWQALRAASMDKAEKEVCPVLV